MTALARTTRPSLAAPLGPWALVTGASDGIGRATALALAAAGCDVIIVGRRVTALDEVRATIESLGRAAVVVVADLGEPAGVAATTAAAAEHDIGTVVLAAGFGTSGPFIGADIDDELAMLAVNCGATVALSHHFGGTLAARGGGALVLYSSLLAFQGVPGSAHYAATKAFVQTLAEGLGRELESRNVDVVSVAPGPVHTGFAARARLQMGSASTPEVVASATVKRLQRRGGPRTIRPGLLAKLLEGSLSTLPRVGRVRVLEKVMAGMKAGTRP